MVKLQWPGWLRRRALVLPLACAMGLAMLFVSESSHWQAMRSFHELGAMAQARHQIEALTQDILAAEAGQRGYLVTGRAEQLPAYHQALADIADHLAWLDRYYADQPQMAPTFARLRALTRDRLGHMAEAVERRPAGPGGATSGGPLDDRDRGQMTAIRAQAGQLLAHEADRAARSRQDLQRTLALARGGLAGLGAISLLALWLYLRQTAALKREQRAWTRAMQSDRERLETEVRSRTAELTELTLHLQSAREDERQRLARNLHDELGALLTSAKLDAARIRSRLAGTAPEALERLAHLIQTLKQSIALGRSIVEDLRPSTLANLGLAETLQILAREFAQASGVEVTADLALVALDPATELTVYRVVQEAITNIGKHAGASRVWLTMGSRDDRVEVVVRDDGTGFTPDAPRRSAYGLVGMRFRVEAAGGTLVVGSAPGRGTQLTLTLPVSASAMSVGV